MDIQSLPAGTQKVGSLHCTEIHQHGEVTEGSFVFGVRRLVSGITHLGESRQSGRQRRELDEILGQSVGSGRRVVDVDARMVDGNDGSSSVDVDLDVVVDVDVGLQGESMQVDQDLGEMTLDLPIRS